MPNSAPCSTPHMDQPSQGIMTHSWGERGKCGVHLVQLWVGDTREGLAAGLAECLVAQGLQALAVQNSWLHRRWRTQHSLVSL